MIKYSQIFKKKKMRPRSRNNTFRFIHIAVSRQSDPNKFIGSLVEAINENNMHGLHEFIIFRKSVSCFSFKNQKLGELTCGSFSSDWTEGPISKNWILALIKSKPSAIILHSFPPFGVPFLVAVLKKILRYQLHLSLYGGEIRRSMLRDLKRYFPISLVRAMEKIVLARALDSIISPFEKDFFSFKKKYRAKNKLKWRPITTFYPINSFFDNASFDSFDDFERRSVRILIGTSALPRNNHARAIEIVRSEVRKKRDEVKIICPLSYGPEDHAKEMIDIGVSSFGDAFVPVTEYQAPMAYKRILASVDIAVLLHEGQQGMGNIRSLLGYGAKIYLANGGFTFNYLSSLGFCVFDESEFSLNPVFEGKEENKILAQEIFSYHSVIGEINEVFRRMASNSSG